VVQGKKEDEVRKLLGALLLAVAGTLTSTIAWADATATITVNGVTRTLSHSGFLFEREGGSGVFLPPSSSDDVTFQYSISVQDNGLPASFASNLSGCAPLHLTICGPTFTGYEVAEATLITFYQDARIVPGYIHTSGDNTIVSLRTHGDSFAESLSQSGTIHVHISNSDPLATYSQLYATYVVLAVIAVPEPDAAAQLACGLGLIGGWAALRRRRAAPRP
jgi:hypothetical protein